MAVLGMTVRAAQAGAARGFAQWGDPKAYDPMIKAIEDTQGNDQSRMEVCASLSWVATDDQMKEVVKKVHQFHKPDPKSAFIVKCYLETLIHKPVPAATSGLVDFLKPEVDMEARHQAARAIGFGGIDRATVHPILEKQLGDTNTRADASLAFLIGGTPEDAAMALQSYDDAPPEAIEELKVIYNQTFGYWSDHNYEAGDLARWIQNAEACRHVRVHGALQDWPSLILERAVQGIEFDNGPHSLTRVQLRHRLLADALGSNDQKRAQAIEILKFLKEKGVLMALKAEKGPVGEMAKQAFFEVMNPKLVTDVLPEVAKKGADDKKPGASP
jgi:hypothetical protein